MIVPFINFPLGSSVRIEDVTHTYMSREQAGCVFRSEVDGRTVTHGPKEIASLYFSGKFVIPRQLHPALPAGIRENLRRSLSEFPDHRQAEAERRLDYVMAIDRLEERGLMQRTRDARDRRVYRNVITPAGLDLLASLDEPLVSVHRKQLGHLGQEKLRTLIHLLEEARSAAE